MNILILGAGGREHALAHTFQSHGHTIWIFPGNGGTSLISQPIPGGDFSIECIPTLVHLAQTIKADLTVVGAIELLDDGIVDTFHQHALKIFGPSQKASILEADKGWAKTFMKKYGIPTAPFIVCDSEEQAKEAVQMYFDDWQGCIVKPCGPTGGRGKTICQSATDALKAIKYIRHDRRFGSAGDRLLVEKKLKGVEVTLDFFCDGTHFIPMVPSQEHKKLFEGDDGPDTEGIGAYAPTPLVTSEMMDKIINVIIARTSAGLIQEGIDYHGILSLNLVVAKDTIYLSEYTCFIGDPQAQVVLPLLKTDLATVMLECMNGQLKPGKISWSHQYSCCVVLVIEGYPFTFPTGDVVTGYDKASPDALVFHIGTKMNGAKQIVTTNGRVISVTGLGATLKEATDNAYQAVHPIDFVSEYFRRDIGFRALHKKEVVGC